MTGGRNKYLITSLVLMVTAIWGGSFVVMKDALVRMDVNSFLGWRFMIATLLLIAMRPKTLKHFNKKFLLKGVVVGSLLGSGYIFQTFGLTQTTVAKTGFITGLYAVFTPLLAAGLFKKQVSRVQWAATALAFAGLAMLSFKGFSLGIGESLVLVSALLFAGHIIALGEWSSGMDTYALTVVQMASVSAISFIASLTTKTEAPHDAGVWKAILFTAVFASAFAFLIQTWTQSFMAPTAIGILLTMEYIFAALFGVIFGHEHLGLRTLIGGSLVIVALVVIIRSEEPATEVAA
ncbi:MAG: DMT family transporter [Actinomycetes bacterium]